MTTLLTSRVALGQYMTVVNETPVGRKTAMFKVLDRHDGLLGRIRWYGAWRQFCFEPAITTNPVFNPDCLERIAAFTAMCTREHMAARSAKEEFDEQGR